MSYACFHAQKSAEFAGYHSPSSGDSPEKIYATPSDDDDEDREWYSESPPRRSLTAAEIREFEEELDALSSHSSDPEGPEDPGDTRGKSIEEITAWCIQYERKQKMERIARQQAGIEGIYQATHMSHMFLACTHGMLACSHPSNGGSRQHVYSADPCAQEEQGLCSAPSCDRKVSQR